MILFFKNNPAPTIYLSLCPPDPLPVSAVLADEYARVDPITNLISLPAGEANSTPTFIMDCFLPLGDGDSNIKTFGFRPVIVSEFFEEVFSTERDVNSEDYFWVGENIISSSFLNAMLRL